METNNNLQEFQARHQNVLVGFAVLCIFVFLAVAILCAHVECGHLCMHVCARVIQQVPSSLCYEAGSLTP